MIHSTQSIPTDMIAKHYDELDSLYRQVWGEHLHHGLFFTGRESIEEATTLLCEKVAQELQIQPGDRICDIGCGYGKTSRYLAEKHQAEVLGISLSSQQLKKAREHSQTASLNFRHLDWLENDFPPSSFDHLIAIESSEHMSSKPRFFSECSRVLRPGGRLVICAWLTGEKPSSFEIRYLLEPICREGRMPSMGSESDYRQFLQDNDFELKSFFDFSMPAKKTWTVSIQKLVRHMATHTKDLPMLLKKFNTNAEFAKSLLRIRLAYETGAMRYCVFTAVKRASMLRPLS